MRLHQQAERRQRSLTPPSSVPAQMGVDELRAFCRIQLEHAMIGASPERLKQIQDWLKR